MTRTKSTSWALLAVLLMPMAANAALIDFEPGNTTTCFTVTCIDRQGFDWEFQSGGWGITHQPFNPSFFNYNTSDGILGAKGAGNGAPPVIVTMTDTGGGVFSLGSLEAATGEGAFSGVSSLLIEGSLFGGGTVSQTLGITSSWSSYTLIGFANLTQVVFSNADAGAGLSLDNLNTDTATVPEPGTLALLAIGLFGMRLARRRKA